MTGTESETEHSLTCAQCGDYITKVQIHDGYAFCGDICIENCMDDEYDCAREQRIYEGLTP